MLTSFALACSVVAAIPGQGDVLVVWNSALDRMRAAWLARIDGGDAAIPLEGSSFLRHVWRGKRVALATGQAGYDPVLIQQLLDRLDVYVATCAAICGNSPPPDSSLPASVGPRFVVVDRGDQTGSPASLADPPPIPDAPGLGRVLAESAEIESLLRSIARREAALPLGEHLPATIARTYFFFQSELGRAAAEGSTAPADAFAFLLAGRANELLGWPSPPDPRPLEVIADAFAEPDRDLSHLPPTSDSDLWTALLLRLQGASGRGDFVERLWRSVTECPPALTTEEAMRNLIVATSEAAKLDQTARFESWGFVIDEATRARIKEALEPRQLRVPGR